MTCQCAQYVYIGPDVYHGDFALTMIKPCQSLVEFGVKEILPDLEGKNT